MNGLPSPLVEKVSRWENQTPPEKARLIGGEHQESACVYVKQWSRRERLVRALRTLGIWWFAALLAVPVPIFHFIAVPLLLFVGICAAFMVYRRTSTVLGGYGRCPFCTESIEITTKPERWPLEEICTHCSKLVTIEKQ